MTFAYDKWGLAPLTPDAQVLLAPCGKCGCGSLCHWDDLFTPGQGQTAEQWAPDAAEGAAPCQRCPCKAYTMKVQSSEGK